MNEILKLGAPVGRWTFRARLNLIHNSSSHTALSIRGYIIQRDTPIWTSPSRIRSAGGRLTRSRSSHSSSPGLDLRPRLHLRLQLRLHRKLHLHLQASLHRNLHLRLQLHLELEVKRSQRCASHREAATATSGRANRDKSATTSPWFRGVRTIRPSQEMSDR